MTLDEIIECIKEVKEDYWEDDGYGYATADCQRITTALDEVMERLKQTRWIPVSERVPQECIHTFDNNFHNYTRSESVLVTIRNEVTNSVYVFRDLAYISNGEWYIDNCYDHNQFKNCSVIAWMSRPEPYRAESEDK